MFRLTLALAAAALALATAFQPAAGPAHPYVHPASADAPSVAEDSLGLASAVAPAAAPLTTSAPAGAPSAGTCPRCENTPDLTQTAPELALPGGGVSHCGPVAAANALAWLAGRGFPALVPGGDVATTPGRLATAEYMATHPRRGTLPFDLVEGLRRWVHDAGYQLEALAYAGVRDHPSRHSAGLTRPDVAFLAAGLEREGVVLLHLGWYEEARPGRLTRQGGHWVTLVDVDRESNTLALHDPAPYARTGATEHARVEPLVSGRLLRPAGLGHLSARGFLELGGGFQRRDEHERAIVDGAIVLRVR